MANFRNEITFKLKAFHYIATFFPFLSVTVCWIIYYTCGHKTTKYLPTISISMIPFPESRIFAVSMSVEAIFVLIIQFTRILTFHCYFKRQNRQLTISNWANLIFTALTGVIHIIGLVILACVTLTDNFYVHNYSASIFFFGAFIHYLFSDHTMNSCGLNVSLISSTFTVLIIIFILVYMFLSVLRSGNGQSYSALFQYASCALIFLKLFCIYWDLPLQTFQIKRANHEPEEVDNLIPDE